MIRFSLVHLEDATLTLTGVQAPRRWACVDFEECGQQTLQLEWVTLFEPLHPVFVEVDAEVSQMGNQRLPVGISAAS